MVSLDSINGTQLFGNRLGTGPFGFLFSESQISDVLGSILYWHGMALIGVIGAAFITGLFENRSRLA